jgi:hypothetical protein
MTAKVIQFPQRGRARIVATRVIPWEPGGQFGVEVCWHDGHTDFFAVGSWIDAIGVADWILKTERGRLKGDPSSGR